MRRKLWCLQLRAAQQHVHISLIGAILPFMYIKRVPLPNCAVGEFPLGEPILITTPLGYLGPTSGRPAFQVTSLWTAATVSYSRYSASARV